MNVLKFVAFGLVIIMATTSTVLGQKEDEDHPFSFWMEKKLEYSQQILSALATEDFEANRKNASAMKRLSRIERFVRRSDVQDYRTQLGVFDFANDELIRTADNKNVEGAALAFTQLTLSCVNCHKVLRKSDSD